MANRSVLPGLLTATVIVLSGVPAAAHQAHVFAHVHGSTIHGEAYLHDKTPLCDAKVTAMDPTGRTIGQTTTDQQGKFTLQAEYGCDHILRVTTDDGHGVEYTVAAADLPTGLTPRAGDIAPGGLESVHREIVSLRRQLQEHQDQTRLRDVLGGIGYIFGIAGVAFYFLGVRRQQADSPPEK